MKHVQDQFAYKADLHDQLCLTSTKRVFSPYTKGHGFTLLNSSHQSYVLPSRTPARRVLKTSLLIALAKVREEEAQDEQADASPRMPVYGTGVREGGWEGWCKA